VKSILETLLGRHHETVTMGWLRNLSTSQDQDASQHKLLEAQAQEYQRDIEEEEHDAPGTHRQRGTADYVVTLIRYLGKVIIITLMIWGIVNLGRRTFNVSIARSGPPPSCSCGGTTTAEAIRRGCVFTPLAIAWLPPHCLDMELSAEFDEAGPGGKWEYWKDANGTIAMTREEMALLPDTDGVFYTSQDWHIKHCTYTWRKHYRSQFTGTIIEARSNGIRHIAHCEGIMRIREPLERIFTRAGIELNADLV
jgi:hypothetical protein